MLTADVVARTQAIFPSLFGVTAAEFETLFADYSAARDRLRATSRTTRRGTPRAEPTATAAAGVIRSSRRRRESGGIGASLRAPWAGGLRR